ncbi:MAG: nitrite/sulfite reductase [Acidobacteria bacterium]|nr:nitrite/sulfite reductase [Acidobacteriota bacterium]
MTWKEQLEGRIPEDLAAEIDTFESQIALRRQGKIDEKVFAETRLRRGVYGQRYDNGQRNDGTGPKTLEYPSDGLTKGPETVWDAPGMQRIKIPMGHLTPEQLDTLADLAEEYSDGVCHVTTRQDIQLHFVHIDDTPDLMRRLAAVGITTREACGNTVRNVTACPLAGVCRDETFDVTPYAEACMRFLLGHPDTQDFGRKFKVAFSGCRDHACGLVSMHDLGLIAVTRTENGVERRGFETYVGGGLGAVPYQAGLFDPFLPVEELLPVAQAISRVFARLGEKRNRARARIKFLVAGLGIEEFKRLVLEERAALPDDPRWTAHIEHAGAANGAPEPLLAAPSNGGPNAEYEQWARTNVYRQRQAGYAAVTVALPLGDMTSDQTRRVADLARQYAGGDVRATVEQNLLLRSVREKDLPALHRALAAASLARPGAGTLADITACPGTDTCKLGIASSRGLAAELTTRFAARTGELDPAVESLRIKTSGCFNSCGQHHIADIGFYGVSRNVGGYAVPHFQVVLGGKWRENASSYGLASGAIPSKRIPEVIERITARFVAERRESETFQDYTQRIGKRALKEMFADLAAVPAHDEAPGFYSDWGDPREFTLGDMGVGECAGEVVSLTEFDFAAAEAQLFDAQLRLEEDAVEPADQLAYGAMLLGARGLVKTEFIDVGDEPAAIVREFRTRFFDTQLFFDKYAGGKFGMYLFRRHESGPRATAEAAHRLIEEAQLFLEACHACQARLAARPAAGLPPTPPAAAQRA